MTLINLLFQNPLLFIILVIPLLYSVIFHEMAHALAAYWMGDDTSYHQGRISLNPLVHIDPLGLLCLLFVGFGWAKPVSVNYFILRQRSKWAVVFVALAGCAVNMIIAIIAILLVKILPGLSSLWFIIARINIILTSLNLIPIPPLDGSRVVMEFLPLDMRLTMQKLEGYSFLVLFVLLYLGILNPVIDFIQNLIIAFIDLFI